MGQYYKPYIKFMDGTEETYCSQNAIYMTRNGLSSTSEIDRYSKCNYDRNDPNSWGSCFSGLKLTEHSWIGNDFMDGIMERIEEAPARVAWVGDYADSCIGEVDGFTKEIYDKLWSDGDGFLPELPFPALPCAHKDGYLVNHSKRIFLDLTAYYTENAVDSYGGKWCIHPLSLLTAIGNGQGGGDYFPSLGLDDVGSWALDIIEYTEDRPDSLYKEVMYRFDSNA